MVEPLEKSRRRVVHPVETTEIERSKDPISVDEVPLRPARSKLGSHQTTAHKGKVRLTLEVAGQLGKQEDAITALGAAGIPNEIVSEGKKRTTGLGITVPVMKPRPRLGVAPEVYATTPLAHRDQLKSMRIAVSADHGAYGRAEQTAQLLRELGVGEVLVIAPKDPERLNYAISTSAALEMLKSGRVDRVVSFCGNGLGALDVANIFAELGKGDHEIRPPVYGDNFWTVVDSQRGDSPANVLCLGARLLNVEGDPLAVYLKAFLDDPAAIDAMGKTGSPTHGVSSTLIDPKPERVANRTLKQSITAEVKLEQGDVVKIRGMNVAIYYDASSPVVKAQAKALQKMLPKTVALEPWDGTALPDVAPDAKVLLMTENGSFAPRTWGFYRPEEEVQIRRAEHWSQVASFARDSREGPLFLDIDCRALTDAATGGRSYDVLRLLTKTFLLTERGEAHQHKKLYGEAMDFAISVAGGQERPDLSSWNEQLQTAVASMTTEGVR